MKRRLLLFLSFLSIFLAFSHVLTGCQSQVTRPTTHQESSQTTELPTTTGENAESVVRHLVENFGQKLQTVSLLADQAIVKKSMQENYGSLVSKTLLEQWQSDPENAPGRMTSSPWPDRIEIQAIDKISDESVVVRGTIIEITSVEQGSSEAAAKRPIVLKVRKIDDNWLIDSVTLGEYEVVPKALAYESKQYGFAVSLPESWKGYSIVTDTWDGYSLVQPTEGQVTENGPIISIRHPLWTSENPRQDIPILVFTIKQWNSIQNEEFHIGAAPIGPTELSRNSRYVFALPARYNYAFLTGFEEVEQILSGNPLKGNENFGS